jgi:hypothetical protein
MPAKRILGLSEIEPLAMTPEELQQHLQSKVGLQELILGAGNRDHVTSGRSFNTTGYVLQLFEYLGKTTTVAEMIAASEDPKLTDRSVINGIAKLNEILYKLLGIKIQHVKETGELRLVSQNDAITATENFAKKFARVRTEYVRTLRAVEAQYGSDGVSRVLAASDGGSDIAELGRLLAPAREAVAA